MFTEFDEQMAVERLSKLYRDRGRRLTDQQIRRHASKVSRQHGMNLGEAYDAIEGAMLGNNPNPEKWE